MPVYEICKYARLTEEITVILECICIHGLRFSGSFVVDFYFSN